MPVSAKITHGTLSSALSLNDETNLLVKNLTISAARDRQDYRNANNGIKALEYTNPTLSFAYRCEVSTNSGLADEHPGTAVTSLANYASDIHGFANTEGVMVYEDPSRDIPFDRLGELSFTVVQYPLVA